jgi:hypothetical protein
MNHLPPWKRKLRPPAAAKTTLSPANLAWARARARRAGRRYPNLVDNLAAVRRQLEEAHRGDAPLAARRGKPRT